MNEETEFEKRLDLALSLVIKDPVVEERIRIYSRTLDHSKTSVFWDEEDMFVEFSDEKMSTLFYEKEF